MSVSSARSSGGSRGEENIEVRRYLDAVWRRRGMIAAIVAIITGAVLIISLILPENYTATTRIVFEETTSPLGQTDEASTQRRLVTTEELLTSSEVLDAAARRVPGADGEELEDKVESSVEEDANIINVSATDRDAERAAQIANAVAQAFLAERERLDRQRLTQAREQLEAEITRIEGTPNADAQVGAIRDQISQLAVSEASVGSDLAVAERAEPPDAPASPRPFRNTVLAFFAALFLGVLIALARDQLTPRVSGSRELGRLLDLPILIDIPHVGGRGGRRMLLSGAEVEAYQTLRSSLELTMPSDRRPHMLLMTGALHAEGKTTATARLGRALAQGGNRVLLVSADLRVPRLHELFGLPLGFGLSDILAVLDWKSEPMDDSLLEQAMHHVIVPAESQARRGELDVITSGTRAKDPGRLIAGPAMRAFLESIRGLDYDYVLVDAPPLIGIADSQALARHVDDVILVNRLDRLTLERLAELRDVIDRLGIRPLGIVVIGTRGEISPYYMQRRPLIEEQQTPS
ncbi:MAG TPA: Wzz/FepE/Etk N-terminal domain-containing protein [Thermoleophilaceae bacterium]